MILSPKQMFLTFLACLALVGLWPCIADSACCGLTAAGKEVQLPSQKVFIDWDPEKKTETLFLQAGFEGDTADFCLVIPTPSKPEVAAAPPDFFAALATFTTLKRRTFPESKLKDPPRADGRRAPVTVLGEGVAGTLGFKTVAADNAAELDAWLKENGYQVGTAREALEHYVKLKWFFTLVKVSPAGIKKQHDGVFAGEVAPIRLTFAAEQIVLPMRSATASVRDQLDLLCYVQAPTKVDLPGPLSYQYQWVGMLRNSRGSYPKGMLPDGALPGKGEDWLTALGPQADAVLRKGKELDFGFTDKRRPAPNKQGGRIATTLEWARRLTPEDIQVLKGTTPYTEVVPDPDEGFSVPDVKDGARAEAIFKVIQKRLDRYAKDRPGGYLVRQAPAAEVKKLGVLTGSLKEGRFVTKFRKIFTREEMKDDSVILPARVGQADDLSEYTELLPVSP